MPRVRGCEHPCRTVARGRAALTPDAKLVCFVSAHNLGLTCAGGLQRIVHCTTFGDASWSGMMDTIVRGIMMDGWWAGI